MVSAIIIDDSERDRDSLRKQLELHPDIDIVCECENAEEGLRAIAGHSPKLIFLDVQMPGMSGLDMLAEIRAGSRTFDVIFTTAYDRFAVRAFRMACLDYLLKPIAADDLAVALRTFRTRRDLRFRAAQFDVLSQHIRTAGTGMARIAIPSIRDNSRHMDFIQVSAIVYCASAGRTGASGNYTTFFMSDGSKLDGSNSIGHYADLLSPFGLIQVHRGYLINPEHMESYNGNEISLRLNGQSAEVSVSRSYKRTFEARLMR